MSDSSIIVISVLPEDIERGNRRSYANCPIALAIRRDFGQGAGVGPTYVQFAPEKTRRALPEDAVAWINDFDNGIEVSPFHFVLPACPVDG